MKTIAALAALAFAIILGVRLSGPVVENWEDRNAHQRSMQFYEEQQREFDLQQYQARQSATLPGKIAADYGLVILLFVGAGGIFWIAYDGYNQRRQPLTRYDPAHPLVARRLIEQADPMLLEAMIAALQLNGQAQIARAHASANVPTNYAPHISMSQPRGLPMVEPAELAALPEPAGGLPDVTDLATLARDFKPTKDSILLALGDGGERLTVPVAQLCHVALCGATGQGKSNLLRLLVPQLQSIGARVVLADPHYADIDPENGDDWRAIRQRLYMPPAVKPRDIDAMLDYMLAELDRRLELRNKGERVGAPLFLAYDELPVITDTVKNAPERLGRILREGRKVAILTVGSSQEFLVKTIGGSSGARDNYRTAYYVGGDRTSAAALLDMPARTIDDGPLGHGVALLRSTATPAARLVRVPLASNAGVAMMLDGYQVATDAATTGQQQATTDQPFGFRPSAQRKPDGSLMVASSNQATSAPGSAEAARAVQLFMQGLDPAAIVLEMRGIKSSEGRRYQSALAEVLELIRQGMRGAA